MSKDQSNADNETDEENKKPGFSLPPIKIPPITLPRIDFTKIPVSLPYPRRPRGIGSYILAGIAIDGIDILMTLFGEYGFVRVLIGAGLSLFVFGPIGILYVWEAIPLFYNETTWTLVPTAVLIAVVWRRRSRIR